METAASESAAVEPTAADARLPARRVGGGAPSMAESAECAGMRARLGRMQRRRTAVDGGARAAMKRPAATANLRTASVEPGPASVEPGAATAESGAAVEARAAAIEVIVIDERPAARPPLVVIVLDSPVVPVGAPMVPAPAESGEEADPEAESEGDPGADCV